MFYLQYTIRHQKTVDMNMKNIIMIEHYSGYIEEV